MSGDAGAAPEAPGPAATSQRVRLIRVKRKRGAEAPEDLVVEQAPVKKANTSLAGAMAGLGLAQQQQGVAEAEAGGATDEPVSQPAVRQQRFRKLSTMSAVQLSRMDQAQLSSLLAAGHGQQAAAPPRAAVKAVPTAPATASADRAAEALQAGQAARYEQIRRRRGLTNFTITEQAPDPLQQLAAVTDLVRHDSGVPAGGGGAAVRRPSAAQRAAAQYDEGTLLCNYLPMVREYLASQGREMPDAAAFGGGAAVGGAAAAAAGPMEAEEAEGMDGDYVYDLYAAVSGDEDEDEDGEQGGGQTAAWRELHAGGRAPIVQIIDDDTWLVVEAGDAEDSDADSEDSNAEGFYAHDYPDEPTDVDSSDDGGYDPEGSTFHRVRRGGGSEASYGYGGDSD